METLGWNNHILSCLWLCKKILNLGADCSIFTTPKCPSPSNKDQKKNQALGRCWNCSVSSTLCFLNKCLMHWSEAVTLAPMKGTEYLGIHLAAEDPCPSVCTFPSHLLKGIWMTPRKISEYQMWAGPVKSIDQWIDRNMWGTLLRMRNCGEAFAEELCVSIMHRFPSGTEYLGS